MQSLSPRASTPVLQVPIKNGSLRTEICLIYAKTNRATEKKHGFRGEARRWNTKRADRVYQRNGNSTIAIEFPRQYIRCKRTSYRRGSTILDPPSRWIRAFSRQSHAGGASRGCVCTTGWRLARGVELYGEPQERQPRGYLISSGLC